LLFSIERAIILLVVQKETNMTVAEMTNKLVDGKHDPANAAEIAAELAEIAAKRAARKPKAEKKPVAKKAAKVPKKAKTAKEPVAPKAAKSGKVGPTVGILSALRARKAGLTTAEIHGLFPNTKKSDITTRLRRAGLVAKDMADPKACWTITKAGVSRLAEIGGAR
jgi:hypothetical protein